MDNLGPRHRFTGLRGQQHLSANSGLEETVPLSTATSSDAGEGSEFDADLNTEDIGDKDDEDDPPDNSPYSQVRAAVRPTDDTTLSINTPRMWTLSLLFVVLGSSTNLFFSLRYPSVFVSPIIALLLAHPLGLLWDKTFKRFDDPKEVFVDGCRQLSASDAVYDADGGFGTSSGSKGRNLRLWLAQGAWNEKEHCCVFICSNVSFGFAFATDVGCLDFLIVPFYPTSVTLMNPSFPPPLLLALGFP